jgi:NAD(P)-dependent dehydrogenase (short-subunit alcohol dehydrogenase family)
LAEELAGKVAIVTGGSNGIGRATVELFVAEGARVVIADLDETRGAELAAGLGSAARFLRTDVSKPEDVQAAIDLAVGEFGRLHVMFNNAGYPDSDYRRLLDRGFEEFDRVVRVNLLGVMLGTQFAARHMATAGGGSVINTSSLAGISAGYSSTIYRAAKAGVVNFTRSAAIEFGEHLVRVNCICPGNIPTGMGKFAQPEPGMSQATAVRIREAINDARMLRQPLKRQGEPIDIANAALFLASDRSAQVTGLIMPVDGGAAAGNVINQMTELLDARAQAIAEG